jgi:hypothetical protein
MNNALAEENKNRVRLPTNPSLPRELMTNEQIDLFLRDNQPGYQITNVTSNMEYVYRNLMGEIKQMDDPKSFGTYLSMWQIRHKRKITSIAADIRDVPGIGICTAGYYILHVAV